MFFGTPHGGGNKATIAGFLANIASIFSGQPRNSLLATLERNSLYNEATTDDFNAQIGDFEGRVVSFVETKKVEIKIKERKFLPQLTSMVSARLGKRFQFLRVIDTGVPACCG
jgi:hypothetical protein